RDAFQLTCCAETSETHVRQLSGSRMNPTIQSLPAADSIVSREGFLMEFRPRHNICTFSMRANITDNDMQIHLRPYEIQLHSPSKNVTVSFRFPKGYSLDLKDFDKFDSDRSWIVSEDGKASSHGNSWRDSTFVKCRMANPPSVHIPPMLREEEFTQANAKGTYEIRCQQCSTSLFKNPVLYRRILPLPTSELSTSSHEWFCHPFREPEKNCFGHETHVGTATEPDYKIALMKAADAEEAALAKVDAAKWSSSTDSSTDKTTVMEWSPLFPEVFTPDQSSVPTREGRMSAKHALNRDEGEQRQPKIMRAKEVCRPVVSCHQTGQSDLFFTINKFIANDEDLSEQVKKRILGYSIVCPNCNVVVGTTIPPEKKTFVDTVQKRVSFYRVCVSLEDCEAKRTLATLNYATLIAKLLRQLIAYKFQIRLLLLSESTPDVLVLWVMENDVLLYEDASPLQGDNMVREIEFKAKHKVLYKKAHRDSTYIRNYTMMVEVLRQKVQQETLEKAYQHLLESTMTNFFHQYELECEGHRLGYVDALV
ncbi:E3 ubiquitin-protein ligase E3D-like, partial [Tropilaelaps mercedesae]